MGGKIVPRIRLNSAKDLVEVDAELGNTKDNKTLNTKNKTHQKKTQSTAQHRTEQNATKYKKNATKYKQKTQCSAKLKTQ